jgi:hypothetical protein
METRRVAVDDVEFDYIKCQFELEHAVAEQGERILGGRFHELAVFQREVGVLDGLKRALTIFQAHLLEL